MYTTLEYETQKAIIEERVRHAALAQHLAVSERRTTARVLRRRLCQGQHRRLRAVVGLLALIGAAVLTFASSALADLPDNCTAAGYTVVCGYRYTGSEQIFTVPSGVDSVQINATGGGGRFWRWTGRRWAEFHSDRDGGAKAGRGALRRSRRRRPEPARQLRRLERRW